MGQSYKAALEAIYAILAADSTLKSYFDDNTVLMYQGWGDPNSPTPYINHRIDGDNPSFAFYDGRYIVDIFDVNPKSDTVNAIAFRIECLLNQKGFDLEDAGQVRVYLHNDYAIPEEEQRHQHYHMEFRIKYFKKAEVTAILAR